MFEYWLAYCITSIIVGVICGIITKRMNEDKGYYGGFWWGALLGIIGIIVIAVKPYAPNYTSTYSGIYHESSSSERLKKLENISNGNEYYSDSGSREWWCPICGTKNRSYLTSCECGYSKKRITLPSSENAVNYSKTPTVINNNGDNIESLNKDNSDYEQIKKLKNLLDDGIITEEEFSAKKKQLLGI